MKKRLFVAVGWLVGFVLWTVAVRCIDVAVIGPCGSFVGFATVNAWFHGRTGVHMALYTITDWLGLVPIAVCLMFAGVGLCQWISRERLLRVDADLLLLGGFYLVMMAVYLLFETIVINYRPVLIEGVLEVSYPSSTTLLVLCVMSTAIWQVHHRIKHRFLRCATIVTLALFTICMVFFRLVSGVHWLTDIVGGVLCSGGMVLLYDAVCHRTVRK